MAAGIMAGTGITSMAAETITDAQAKEIALADAGLTADQVTFDRIEMGTEQGASVYEIEFKTANMEYDYDVAIADGEIVEESWEIRHPSASGNQISEAEAKSIAVKDAGASEADVTFIKTENGDEDVVPVYEIEFEDQNTKFDYDVAKAGGDILHASRKVKVPACVAAQRASADANTGKTGEEAAIEAALNHAGLTESDVSGLYCHKDYDDGREVYEVEFHQDAMNTAMTSTSTTTASLNGIRTMTTNCDRGTVPVTHRRLSPGVRPFYGISSINKLNRV